MEFVVKTENVKKVYGEGEGAVHALNGVSLEVGKGEFTAIVGPSGSGKTTLLNLIGGLDSPSSGMLEVAGKNITKMSENDLIDFRLYNIGFVFQAYNLIPVLTAKENVEFVMLLQNWDKEKMDQRSTQLLKAVGLEKEMNKRPNEMSGGQQQRVAVARALASKPSFILADEPTANLDSKSTANLLDIMHNLNQEEGITFLFSTHDQRVIDRADRIVVIEDGIILSDSKV
jgi:putative ABC transport system ATP-binding protein